MRGIDSRASDLQEILGPRLVESIVALLRCSDAEIRESAAQTMAHLGRRLTASQVETLLACVADHGSRVRAAAIEALGQIGERLSALQIASSRD